MSGSPPAHDYIRVMIGKLRARGFTCSHCSQRSRSVRYRCLSCPDVSLCSDCHEAAANAHAGHAFEKVDAAARVAALRANPVPDICWCDVPRAGCPTCFGQRPDRITYLPSWLSERSGQSRECWTSQHDIFMSDFEVSSMAGCQLCSLVYRALTALASIGYRPSHSIQLSVAPEQISIWTSGPTTSGKEAIIKPRFGSSPPWRTMALAPRIPPRFGSRECFQRLRGWLDECRTKHKHPRCQEIRDTHSDPGRLVYVGHGSGSDPLQLVSTDAGPHPYIALMHCWGTETFIKTTTSNVDAFHQELDEDLLPQSFKDAIKCARAIGVDHVWIDALCIVQDDLSDWQRESAKMRDIYGNAVLLVVADSAPNAAAGFVGARPPEKAGIALEEHDGHDTHEFVVRVPMEHAPGYTASRAWCLQEMVLARRCVIFSSDEMRWECNSLVTCECGANGSPFVVDVDVRRPYADFLAQYHLVESTKETLRDFEEENSTSSRITVCDVMPDIASRSAPVQRPFQGFDSNEDVYNDWRLRVINTFTGMQLTRPTDRLPALSGFASLVGGRLATRYLAGLWLDDLPLGLLWYVHRNDRILSLPDPAPDKYYGPSFSWVSVDGPAKYSYLGRTIDGKSRFKSMIRVHDAKCHVPGQNSYGEVTAGEIRLTGPLRSAILTKTVFHYPKHPTEGTGLSDRLGCEHDLENERDGVPDDPINFIFELDTRVAAARCPSPTAVRSPQEVYEPFSIAVDLLLIGKTWGLPRHSLAIYAALVLGLSPSRPGAYERLGIVQVRFNIDEPDGRQWVERFERREILLV